LTSLALENVERRLKHKRRQVNSAGDEIEPGQVARLVADGIVDGFLRVADSLGRYYRDHPEQHLALVEKTAEVIERAMRLNTKFEHRVLDLKKGLLALFPDYGYDEPCLTHLAQSFVMILSHESEGRVAQSRHKSLQLPHLIKDITPGSE